MAKPKNVVVSDRKWRWVSQPGGVAVSAASTFRIVAVDACTATYLYGNTTGVQRQWTRPIADIAAHAEPEPLPAPTKCEPGCTPARPCWTERACPAFNERSVTTILALNKDYAIVHLREAREREPIELRCGRNLACGLFRTP